MDDEADNDVGMTERGPTSNRKQRNIYNEGQGRNNRSDKKAPQRRDYDDKNQRNNRGR